MPTSLLGSISNDLLIPKERLDYLIRSAPFRYKVYKIPKRSGSGFRTIAQPAKEIKKLQYWVIDNIYPSLPIHPSAMAYVKEKSILNNAEIHSDKPYMLKLDFKDFFPSIKANDFLQYVQRIDNIDLSEEDTRRLMLLLFWFAKGAYDLQLSIGAPSSPFLSNAIMYNFDSMISEYCSVNNVAYTRYADDMTFSMHDMNMRGQILKKANSVLDSLPFPTLKLNKRKTVFGSKAHRRIVTGLILANDGSVSLGRERKRILRAQIHHLIQGKLNEKQKDNLRGMLAFAHSIEPDFIKRMEKKYGQQIIRNL